MKLETTKKNKKGFALLFSVLVSSLLLTIGLSIFSISLKELAISTASRQSVHAFYAADSGLQCALYWDTKKGQFPTLITGQNGGNIICGGKSDSSMNMVNNNYVAGGLTYAPTNAQTGGYIFVDPTDTSGPNFYITVQKSWHPGGQQTQIDTIINSYGHDTIGGDRVERAIFQSY